jgi:hypothetical protein
MNPEIAQGIVATAQRLGMNPLDLATIISYETGGTFSPTQRGPTTQWGQHRGLIQFGEPQAREYGVNWQDPLRSQLGPDGAVAKYFVRNGWKPGMGILDAYSIVNAGGPGRYRASDANNGGAPGTVADKVRDQFAPHRAKAAQMLGGYSMGEPAPDANALAGLGGPMGYSQEPQQPQRPPQPQLSMLDPRAFMREPAPVNLLGFV